MSTRNIYLICVDILIEVQMKSKLNKNKDVEEFWNQNNVFFLKKYIKVILKKVIHRNVLISRWCPNLMYALKKYYFDSKFQFTGKKKI